MEQESVEVYQNHGTGRLIAIFTCNRSTFERGFDDDNGPNGKHAHGKWIVGTPCVVPPPATLFLSSWSPRFFFTLGVPNNLNDVLIRHFMKSFAISRFQAGLVQSAFYLGYFLLAIPAALMMKRVGYKGGIVMGLLLFAAGAFLFWPAALAGSYAFFLFALFVIATGLSFLETASNPFIAQLGDPDSSERRLNFSQAFNPLGAITG